MTYTVRRKMTNVPSDMIRKKRELIGLSEKDVYEKCGLQAAEYHDLEAYPDEAYTVVRLGSLLKVCQNLDLGIGEIFGWGLRIAQLDNTSIEKDIIRKRREACGLSLSELSDSSGVKERGVLEAEANVSALLDWPVEYVVALSQALQIAPIELVAAAEKYSSHR